MMRCMALALMLAVPGAALAETKPAPAPAQTQPALAYPQALILIRSALAAVQQANETGDYDVLYRLGSANFQASNPPAKLAQTFAPTRAYNLNAVLVAEPKFTALPHIVGKNQLAMEGFFPIDGHEIRFMLIYEPEGQRWRMLGIGVDVK